MSGRDLLFAALVGLLIVATSIPCAAKPGAKAKPPAASDQVLILYDTAGEWGWVGEIHARMLANLLGHFPVTYKASPIEKYRRGDIERYLATFYIGSSYRCGSDPLPRAFLRDVMSSAKPICWFKYNIWHLAWCDQLSFQGKFGFGLNGLVGLAPDDPIYDTICYNGETFTKYPADPELGWISVLDPGACTEIAAASRITESGDEDTIPYIVKGANLWYIADVPFSYVSEEDRYLIFCDVLHDILGIDHPDSKRAIARIEDVGPTADPAALRSIADYLYDQGVPFAVSVIPFYSDPLGCYNGGLAESDRLSWQPDLVAALHYMVEKGGEIVLHGRTHQYGSTPNPYTGATGDDFEFYRIELDTDGLTTIYAGPVPEDSKRWVTSRIKDARAELHSCGLQEIAWETPHYAASALDYKIFASKFPLTIQRLLCFDLRIPAHGFKGTGDPTYFGGQFFPYVINHDIYGQRIIPENLGCIDPFGWWGYPIRMPDAILRAAENNAVLRDAWASFYFHSFYDLGCLDQIVQGIKSLGYTFVPLSPEMQ